MALLQLDTDYTAKDFESLRARAFDLARSRIPGWTDDGEASFDNFLLELAPWAADFILFYLDRLARESRLSTALVRSSIIAIGKAFGYRPAGRQAARATVRFTLAQVPAGNFSLPAFQVVRTAGLDPVSFQLQEPLEILAGTDPPTAEVLVENSVRRDEPFASTELPGQRVTVQFGQYVDQSVAVNAANGLYEERQTLFLSGPTDRHFVVQLDEEDRLTLIFGNGDQGAIPTGTINTFYSTGGGLIGNVDAETITVIDGAFTDSLGNPVQISLVNDERATGGEDRPTEAQLREEIAISNQSPRTTVGEDDFVNNANRAAGIARVLALSSDQDPLVPESTVNLFLVPEEGGQPTQEQIDDAINQVTVIRPTLIGVRVQQLPTTYTAVNIRARLFRRAGFSQAVVRANIEARLQTYFAIRNEDGSLNQRIDFGYRLKDQDGNPAPEIAWSTIFREVANTDGVRKIGDQDDDFLLNGASDDVPLTIKAFPELGTIQLFDGSNGQEF